MVLVILLLCGVAGCRLEPAENAAGGGAAAATRRAALVAAGSRLFGYGPGPRQVAVRPGRPERLASGVSALAFGPKGRVFLLDRLNGRVLRVDGAGDVTVAARVAEDVVDIAIGADQTIAAFSALRARVWLSRSGEKIGELAVPRTFRLVQGLELAASGRLVLRTAMQERFVLGSPRAPQTLGQVLHSKREGAFELADGSALQVELVDGAPRLLVVAREGNGRTRPRRSIALPRQHVIAARLVGAAKSLACLRLERRALVAAGPRFVVEREALCVDSDSGAVRFARTLPAVGLYVPRHEVALDPSGKRLAMIVAEPAGLRLHVWSIGGGAR